MTNEEARNEQHEATGAGKSSRQNLIDIVPNEARFHPKG